MNRPHTKLNQVQVKKIRADALLRDEMRKKITEELSNEAMAARYGVHVRTIEKVLRYETHIGIYP